MQTTIVQVIDWYGFSGSKRQIARKGQLPSIRGVSEQALITVSDLAGQRLAHATNDLKLNGADVTPMMMLTFETVPQLVKDAFFAQFD